jgi:hypothetical protein
LDGWPSTWTRQPRTTMASSGVGIRSALVRTMSLSLSF